MADEKLSELPVVSTPLLGTDQLYLVRDDTSYQTTVDDVLANVPPPTAIAWGNITGDIVDQADLEARFLSVEASLDNKADNGPATSSGLTMNSGFVLGRFSPGNGALEELSVTGTGDVVRQVSPALITPNLDTPSAINLTNATAVPAGQVVGIIPIANLASGTPNGAKFIRDDGTLAVPAGSGGTVTAVSSANGDLTVATGTTTPVLTVVSAPKLTTARNINGVAFDGTGDITVTAAAGTLTGTTLNATVVTSSLTAVGDLVTGSIGTGFVVKGVTMTLGSDANYDVYYRNSSGVLTRLANGTTGQFLAATTGAAPSWGTPSGSGTVTNTGTLTSNSIVLGNGSADVKVVAGITTDGTSQINLGVASTTLGKLKLFGNTSGDVTLQPNAVAGTGIVLTLPATTTTLVGLTTSDLLTNKTLTSPVINGATSSGSTAIDFSGNSGAFKTSTGLTTVGAGLSITGNVVINGAAISPNIGLWNKASISNSGTVAGQKMAVSLTATANTTNLWPLWIEPINLGTSSFTSLTYHGVHIGGSSTVISGSALGTAAQLFIEAAPIFGTTYGVYQEGGDNNLFTGAISGLSTITAGTGLTVTSGASALKQTTIAGAAATTALTVTQTARTSGILPYIKWTIPTDTGQTASTESPGVQVVTGTRTWATTGTVALQREVFFAGPTYASASASQTFTEVFNLYLTPPVQGTNAIFTRAHSLGIVDSTSAASSITGGLVVATTLGTSATSVGIGGGNVNAGGTVTGNILTATTSMSVAGAAITNEIPQNSQTANYTYVLADAGKNIFHPSSDNNARTFTIPANSSVAFPIGTVLGGSNHAATASILAITTDTLIWLPTGATGSRTVAQYGKWAATKITSTSWEVTGIGLT